MSLPWEDFAPATAVADKPPWEDFAQPAAAEETPPWADFAPAPAAAAPPMTPPSVETPEVVAPVEMPPAQQPPVPSPYIEPVPAIDRALAKQEGAPAPAPEPQPVATVDEAAAATQDLIAPKPVIKQYNWFEKYSAQFGEGTLLGKIASSFLPKEKLRAQQDVMTSGDITFWNRVTGGALGMAADLPFFIAAGGGPLAFAGVAAAKGALGYQQQKLSGKLYAGDIQEALRTGRDIDFVRHEREIKAIENAAIDTGAAYVMGKLWNSSPAVTARTFAEEVIKQFTAKAIAQEGLNVVTEIVKDPEVLTDRAWWDKLPTKMAEGVLETMATFSVFEAQRILAGKPMTPAERISMAVEKEAPPPSVAQAKAQADAAQAAVKEASTPTAKAVAEAVVKETTAKVEELTKPPEPPAPEPAVEQPPAAPEQPAPLLGTPADTRTAAIREQANKEVAQTLDLKEGDTITGVDGVHGNMSTGTDKTYRVDSINPDGTVNLTALESGRQMPDATLFGYDARQNVVAKWSKVEPPSPPAAAPVAEPAQPPAAPAVESVTPPTKKGAAPFSDLFPDAKGTAPTLDRARRALDEADAEVARLRAATEGKPSSDPGYDAWDKAIAKAERLRALTVKLEKEAMPESVTPPPVASAKGRGAVAETAPASPQDAYEKIHYRATLELEKAEQRNAPESELIPLREAVNKAERDAIAAENAQPTAQPTGEGPGTPPVGSKDFVPPQPSPTSIKNASIDEARYKRGEEPIMSAIRKADAELYDAASAKVDADPELPQKLVDRQLAQPDTAITDEESIILTTRRVELKNDEAALRQNIIQAKLRGDFADAQVQQDRLDKLMPEVRTLEEVARTAGTATGRALRARQIALNDDFSIAKMEREWASESPDGKLTPEAQAEIKKHYEAIANAKAAQELAAEKAKSAQLQSFIDEIAKKTAQPPTPPAMSPVELRVKSIVERMESYWDKQANAAMARIQARRAEGRMMAGIDPADMADYTIWGVSKMAKGVIEKTRWMAEMLKDLGEHVQPHLDRIYAAADKQWNKSAEAFAGGDMAPAVKRAVRQPKPATPEEADVADRGKALDSLRKKAEANDPKVDIAIQKLARFHVEQGVKERDALVDAVHNDIKDILPDFTREDTRDAISGYGRFKPLTKDEVSVQLRDLKGQLQAVAKLEAMQERGEVPAKTGIERRTPSDTERELNQQVERVKKELNLVSTNPEAELKTAQQTAETRLRNNIVDLARRFETGEAPPESKTVPLTERGEVLKAMRDRVREVVKAVEKKPGTLTDAEIALNAEKARILNRYADYADRLKAREFGPRTAAEKVQLDAEGLRFKKELDDIAAKFKEAKDNDPEVQRIKLELAQEQHVTKLKESVTESLRRFETGEKPAAKERRPQTEQEKQIAWVQEQMRGVLRSLEPKPAKAGSPAKPTLSADEIAQRTIQTRLLNQYADYVDRLTAENFAPRKAKERPDLSPENQRYAYELEQAKNAYLIAKSKWLFKNLPFTKKAIAEIAETFNMSRSLLSAGDLSGFLRQGGFIVFGHPVRAAKQFGKMVQAMASDYGAFKIQQEIATRPNSKLYKKAGVEFTDYHSDVPLSHQEEAFMARFLWKAPVLNQAKKYVVDTSNRAYTTILNLLRADTFDALLAKSANPRDVSDAKIKALAEYVNIATGRGSMGKAAMASQTLATVFWSPRLVTSRFQLLLGKPMWGGTMETRRLIATEYARMLGGVAGVIALGIAAGGKVEDDPRSASFGKLKFGNTFVDPLMGLSQSIVFMFRLATGETKAQTGKIEQLRGEKPSFGASTTDVIARFLRAKLSPMLGTAVNLLEGKNVVGEKATPAQVAQSLTVPLSLQDIYKVMRDNGVAAGSAIMLLSLLGMGVQNYTQKPEGWDNWTPEMKKVWKANNQ